MPKTTFNNLSSERQSEILDACTEEFESKPFYEVSISSITEKLGIARSAFYKYFDNIEECYFYLLYRTNFDIHSIFIKCFCRADYDIEKTFIYYIDDVSDMLFNSKRIGLLKNFFLNNNYSLEKSFYEYKDKMDSNINPEKKYDIDRDDFLGSDIKNMPEIRDSFFIFKCISHEIIKQSFINDWDRDEFRRNFKNYMNIALNGILEYVDKKSSQK